MLIYVAGRLMKLQPIVSEHMLGMLVIINKITDIWTLDWTFSNILILGISSGLKDFPPMII